MTPTKIGRPAKGDLGVWAMRIGPDTVVAFSAADAWAVWGEHTGEDPADYSSSDEWLPVAPDARLDIIEPDLRPPPGRPRGDTVKVSATAARWVEANGRGFLCSTEW